MSSSRLWRLWSQWDCTTQSERGSSHLRSDLTLASQVCEEFWVTTSNDESVQTLCSFGTWPGSAYDRGHRWSMGVSLRKCDLGRDGELCGNQTESTPEEVGEEEVVEVPFSVGVAEREVFTDADRRRDRLGWWWSAGEKGVGSPDGPPSLK